MDINNREDLLQVWSSPAGAETPPAEEAFQVFSRKTGLSERTRLRRMYLLGAGAVILLLIPIAFCAGLHKRVPATQTLESEYVEYYTPRSVRDTLHLPDGSKVILNSGSRLLYPTAFASKERKVFLYGEAFFDVERDEQRPFRVHSCGMDVKVLGTRFSMNAYDDSRFISVTLQEGSVDVGPSREGGQRIRMRPGEVVRYDKTKGSLEVTSRPAESGLSWKEGAFYFHKQPLQEIVAQYERAFDKRILIEGRHLGEKQFTVAFVNGEDLDTMLSAMARIGNFRVRHEDGNILLTEK